MKESQLQTELACKSIDGGQATENERELERTQFVRKCASSERHLMTFNSGRPILGFLCSGRNRAEWENKYVYYCASEALSRRGAGIPSFHLPSS